MFEHFTHLVDCTLFLSLSVYLLMRRAHKDEQQCNLIQNPLFYTILLNCLYILAVLNEFVL